MLRINKNIKIIFLILLCFISLDFISCSKDKGFTNTELGFSFKRCTKHDSSPKAKQGDIIYGQMKILLNNKVLVCSNYGSPARLFVVSKAVEGGIDEFLQTLHVGDSAVMIAPCDSLQHYIQNIETRPGDKLYIYLTVSQIISKAELSGEEKEIELKQRQEEEALTEYVLNKYSRAEKKPSGLFFLLNNRTNGRKVEYGKRVYVAYTVMDTAGKVYDTSIEEVAKKAGLYRPERMYKPFDFILGDDALIAGWSEGLSYMRVGEMATLVIPSKLAYGNVGFGKIPPYTPLVFEVSVVKMSDDD